MKEQDYISASIELLADKYTEERGFMNDIKRRVQLIFPECYSVVPYIEGGVAEFRLEATQTESIDVTVMIPKEKSNFTQANKERVINDVCNIYLARKLELIRENQIDFNKRQKPQI